MSLPCAVGLFLLGHGLMTLVILGVATAVIFVKHQDNPVRIRNKTEIGLMSTIKGENRMK